MTELSDTLDGPRWLEVLERLARQLGKEGEPVRLCLIGSSACLFGGMESRTSRDLDVWLPVSDYDRQELQQATEAVGLLYNPKSTLEPDRPYLQIIEPGVVEIGEFTPVRLERIGRLHLLRPPVENLIASKLIRGDARDVTDILFLQHHYRPDPDRIRAIVAGFSPFNRQRAEENLVYLNLTTP
jgi:hypothetical protein